uniref:Metalloprotease TIKI homolog n=1 Tax=Meloidogyne javanica TaxID=6303 RepID=A0A915MBK0_MELJA
MQRIHLKLVKHAYMTHRRHSHARRYVKRFFPNDWEIRRPIWLLFLLFQLGDSPPHLQEINSQIIPTPLLDLYLAQLANEQNKNLISLVFGAHRFTQNGFQTTPEQDKLAKEIDNLLVEDILLRRNERMAR